MRHDEDGVEVVENLPGSLTAAAEWFVDPTPELAIGVARGPEELQLFRVTDAATLGDHIVVVNAGTHELRRFDREGRFIDKAGRGGEGPGEFVFPHRLWVLEGPSIVVWDPGLRRLSFFDGEGRFERMVVPSRPGSNPEVVAVFADGAFAVTDWTLVIRGEDFEDSPLELSLFSPEGELVRALGSWPHGRTGRFGEIGRVGRQVFDAMAHVAGAPGSVWAGSAREAEVTRFAAGGQRTQVVRWPVESRIVEPRHVDAHFRARVEDDPDDEALVEELRRVQPVTSHFPEYETLIADEAGRLWVKRYRAPGDEGGEAWLVFDRSGALVARATTPRGFAPFEIGEDYLLGARIDAAGFEQVVMYRLSREPGNL